MPLVLRRTVLRPPIEAVRYELDNHKRKYGAATATSGLELSGRAVRSRIELCERIVTELHGVSSFEEAVRIHWGSGGWCDNSSSSRSCCSSSDGARTEKPLFDIRGALRLHYSVSTIIILFGGVCF